MESMTSIHGNKIRCFPGFQLSLTHQISHSFGGSSSAIAVGVSDGSFSILGSPTDSALEIFNRMLDSGGKPDHVTLIGVLCACIHAGMVEEGRHYFLSMNKDYCPVPSKDHYTCMVDLLGRANCLVEAKNLIESMLMQLDAIVWGSLLGACKVHGNIELREYVAEKLLHIDSGNSGPYALPSNMYAELGRWANVAKVRKLMRQRGVVKQPGCSWFDINNETHTFMVKVKSHPEIHSSLKFLIEQMKLVNHISDVDMHLDDCPTSFQIECS